MSSSTRITSYDEAVANHRWDVPERYNIAADVCDRHPREKLAMIHEDFHGNVRRVDWGELQDAANRFANVLVAAGVSRGDRVAMLLPPAPETARESIQVETCWSHPKTVTGSRRAVETTITQAR